MTSYDHLCVFIFSRNGNSVNRPKEQVNYSALDLGNKKARWNSRTDRMGLVSGAERPRPMLPPPPSSSESSEAESLSSLCTRGSTTPVYKPSVLAVFMYSHLLWSFLTSICYIWTQNTLSKKKGSALTRVF